jgi:hypothetical protein
LALNHTHYLEYRDLRGDGRIVLYKRADHQNPKWTARLKIPNSRGFVVKSCKTTDDFEARRFAEDLYYELEGRARRGESLTALTFKQVFEGWSKSISAERRIRNKGYVDGNVRRVELWAVPFLGDYRIDLISDNILADYVEWRLATPEEPEPATLKNERTAINHVLRFANEKGTSAKSHECRYVRAAPVFVRIFQNPSGISFANIWIATSNLPGTSDDIVSGCISAGIFKSWATREFESVKLETCAGEMCPRRRL